MSRRAPRATTLERGHVTAIASCFWLVLVMGVTVIVLSATRPHLDKWGPPLGMPVPHVISGSLKESSADAVFYYT